MSSIPSYFHCNRCYSTTYCEGYSVTSCRHVFCPKCVGPGTKRLDQCLRCNQIGPQVADLRTVTQATTWFDPVDAQLSKLSQQFKAIQDAYSFQLQQLSDLVSFRKQENSKQQQYIEHLQQYIKRLQKNQTPLPFQRLPPQSAHLNAADSSAFVSSSQITPDRMGGQHQQQQWTPANYRGSQQGRTFPLSRQSNHSGSTPLRLTMRPRVANRTITNT